MRFRLRTLLIVLALGPPVLGLACPRFMRDYNAWRTERAERADRAKLDAVLAELLDDCAKRPSIHGGLLQDLYGEQPRAMEAPVLFAPVAD
jgi:hypothetical protein